MTTATTPAPTPLPPRLFISSVSPEFKTLRMEVAKVTRQLGYHPVTMDDWSTGHGELQAWLRHELDSCEGIIHIPGIAYGAEPAKHDPAAHGLPADTPRYSYTQYEFLYAQQQGLKTWVITPGPGCTRDRPIDQLDLPSDPAHPDPAGYQSERRALQAAYLQRLRDQNHLRHQPADDKDLRIIIHTLRDHAEEMRQRFGEWQTVIDGRGKKHTRLLLGIAAAIIVMGLGVLLVRQTTLRTASDVQVVIQKQEEQGKLLHDQKNLLALAVIELNKITEEKARLGIKIQDLPRKAIEEELAVRLGVSAVELRLNIEAGKQSKDALTRAHASLLAGMLVEARAAAKQVREANAAAIRDVIESYKVDGQAYYQEAKYELALESYQKAVALVDKATDPLGWAYAQGEVAFIHQDLARYNESEPLKREVLRLREQHLPPNHPHIATALSNLATLLKATNRLAEAEPLMQRVVTIFEKAYGLDHPKVATALNNLAQLLGATNRLAEAEPLMRRALQIDEASYGPDHPHIATALNNLAQLLKATDRLAEAEPYMRRVVTILENKGGEPLPNYGPALNNLALLLKATNRLTEAEPLLRRALQIDEASYGPDHPDVATALNNLAQLLKATNRLGEAEPHYRRALQIYEASYGPDHPDVATALNNLAILLQDTNRLTEAEPLLRRALKIDEASYGPDHPEVATALNNLAGLLQATNRLTEAEPLLRRAVGILVLFNERNGHVHPEHRNFCVNYFSILTDLKLPKEVILEKLRSVGAQ